MQRLLLLLLCLIPFVSHAADTSGLRVVAKDPATNQTAEVKLFAAEHPLPVPTLSANVAAKGGGGTDRLSVQRELAVMTDINGLDLVDYFKGIAAKLGIALYEDSLYVQTRPK